MPHAERRRLPRPALSTVRTRARGSAPRDHPCESSPRASARPCPRRAWQLPRQGPHAKARSAGRGCAGALERRRMRRGSREAPRHPLPRARELRPRAPARMPITRTASAGRCPARVHGTRKEEWAVQSRSPQPRLADAACSRRGSGAPANGARHKHALNPLTWPLGQRPVPHPVPWGCSVCMWQARRRQPMEPHRPLSGGTR
mmetsp:Transcript_14296/g.37052  ORF Transcript_14296/g.37052 Transcript_14296/m.37052 type:complete len:202 (+) Transcript_14296:409-1014(+)